MNKKLESLNADYQLLCVKLGNAMVIRTKAERDMAKYLAEASRVQEAYDKEEAKEKAANATKN